MFRTKRETVYLNGDVEVITQVKPFWHARRYHIDIYEGFSWVYHNDFYGKEYVAKAVNDLILFADTLAILPEPHKSQFRFELLKRLRF